MNTTRSVTNKQPSWLASRVNPKLLASMIAAGTLAAQAATAGVTITAPKNGASVSGAVTITADTTWDVRQVKFYVDNIYIKSGPPYSVSWNSANVENGQHKITARAYNRRGSRINSSSVLVVVNNASAPGGGTGGGGTSKNLPRGASLPSEADCSGRITRAGFEPRPQNATANSTVPSASQLQTFRAAANTFLAPQNIPRITGNFTGTTDEIIQWAACKWGFDPEGERGVAVVESDWLQSATGDAETDQSLCPPGTWNGSKCYTSYGILQVKYEAESKPAYPMTRQSTAFNVDYKLGNQHACYNGKIDYLSERTPAQGYPTYPNGTDDQMYWGCIGWHYSGGWYDQGAINYIKLVKTELQAKRWLLGNF
ncbi:Ig-like domain-containing protein [Methylomagnum sp.]